MAHSGPRDAYQVAAALAEIGSLDSLVTDLYWPADHGWARKIEGLLRSDAARRALRMRSEKILPSNQVKQCAVSGVYALLLRKMRVPFGWKQWAMRRGDAQIGETAGRLAARNGSALLSYSYYGYWAFGAAPPEIPRILFQLHPHPLSVRRILKRELERFPECAASLLKEWELAVPEEDFDRLANEARMAGHWIVASSFTRATLVENGLPAEKIHMAPYGTDLDRFAGRPAAAYRTTGPLTLLFVGSINQRKGIRYLLNALDLLKGRDVRLLICGRVVDDLSIFRNYADRVEIRPSVTSPELAAAYHAADLFVLPSLAEGFGHVLLEAMASGLPVLSTTHTAAPDLVEPGREGFVVQPGSAELLAERIGWALAHRRQLVEMGRAGREKAEEFTWDRFRQRVAQITTQILDGRAIQELANV